jgi:hypothetical protein
MGWLIGLAVIVAAGIAMASKKEAPSRGETVGHGWSILLKGPAVLPQSTILELANDLGIYNWDHSKTFLSSPQAGYNVLTIVSDDVMPEVGKRVTVQGVPLEVVSVQPAPIG